MGNETHSLDNPGDFVRQEVDTALKLNVHTIPILVERAPMPDQALLPETLRPLTRHHALDLENARWESDVARLVRAVEPYVDRDIAPIPPTVDADTSAHAAGDQHPPGRRRKVTRRTFGIGLGAVLVALALVILFLVLPGSTPKKTPLGTAAIVVRTPADRLVQQLLSTNFPSSSLPSDVSASAAALNTYRANGLVANVIVPISGPAENIAISYDVFDSPGDANSFYTNGRPVVDGFTMTGTFSAAGVGGSVRCATGHTVATSSEAQLWSSDCLTLTGNVVSFIHVNSTTDNRTSDDGLSATLTADAVSHLGSVASTTPKTPSPPPPGSLSPDAQFEQILNTTISPSLVPEGLTSPRVYNYTAGSGGPSGLVSNSYLELLFDGPGYSNFTDFWVFDSVQDAQTWFNTSPEPSGSTKTNIPLDSSGFSQETDCANYSRPANGSTPVLGYSWCDVLWGNVVVIGGSTSSTNTQEGDGDVAVTLARVGVLYLNQIVG